MALVAAVVFGASILFFRGLGEPFIGPTWTVVKERLRLTIVERGGLESAENSDIYCRVKSGSKGATATTIRWVIDDGSRVEKNDVVMLLDDSGLKEQLEAQVNTLNKAEADWLQAVHQYTIQESTNKSKVETALTELSLKQLDLKKYVGQRIALKLMNTVKTRDELQLYLTKQVDKDLEADEAELEKGLKTDASGQQQNTVSEFLQARSDNRGKVNDARSTREQAQDRAAWSQRMFKKGYTSRSQADADQLRLDSSENNFRKAQLELQVLEKYTLEKTVTELWSKFKEAERSLEREEIEAKSKEAQARIDRNNKQVLFRQVEDKKLEIEDEIRKCTILSPQKGLVVYHMTEQSSRGFGSQQSIIAQGEPVREGQKMMRIPNLNKMLVNTRVHEAMVARIRGEVTRPTYFTDAFRAGLVIGTHSLEMLTRFEAMDNLKDKFKDRDYRIVFPGQVARIRVDAAPGKIFEGHVKSVAAVASMAEFFSSDVKVYTTMVSIDTEVENLKPGMSAEVSILADESSEPVLVIPIQSVVGSISMGSKRKCFVLDSDGHPKEREIVVGMSNDKVVEVRTGLEEGEKVVLSPRPLLGDKSDMKVAVPPGSKRGADFEEGAGGAGGKKKGMKGKDGGFPGGPGGQIPGGQIPGGFNPGGNGPPAGFNPAQGGGIPDPGDAKKWQGMKKGQPPE